jgi:hypothetical protein
LGTTSFTEEELIIGSLRNVFPFFFFLLRFLSLTEWLKKVFDVSSFRLRNALLPRKSGAFRLFHVSIASEAGKLIVNAYRAF